MLVWNLNTWFNTVSLVLNKYIIPWQRWFNTENRTQLGQFCNIGTVFSLMWFQMKPYIWILQLKCYDRRRINEDTVITRLYRQFEFSILTPWFYNRKTIIFYKLHYKFLVFLLEIMRFMNYKCCSILARWFYYRKSNFS